MYVETNDRVLCLALSV